MHIVLLYSGNPLPAMLEIGSVAATLEIDVDLILVDRSQRDLSVDNKLVNYPVTRVESPHNGVNVRRILGFPITFLKIAKVLIGVSRKGSVVITSTLDMLLIARFVAFFSDIRIRHQVRDLHAIQLGQSFKSRILRKLEGWLLNKAEMLIYSAPAFYDEYYAGLYQGQTVLLENLPQPAAWKNFTRHDFDGVTFKIGYIGIIRYMNPLMNLVKAVEDMNSTGIRCSVLFAGGGNAAQLKELVRTKKVFNFVGRFEYTVEVARLHNDIDLIYAVYDRFDRNCQIAMPTKFYEALITRIPIMVSKDTFVGKLVEEMGIGIAVDGESVEALVAALTGVFAEDSWYKKAKSKLSGLNIQDWYDNYQSALNIVVSDGKIN